VLPSGSSVGSAFTTLSSSKVHFYSVPYVFARSEVEVADAARPSRSFLRASASPLICAQRQPPAHHSARAYAIKPSALRRLDHRAHSRAAASIGPTTAPLCELILEGRPHPEQAFRACLGIVRLVRPFGADRLEAAAMRAIEIGTPPYQRAIR